MAGTPYAHVTPERARLVVEARKLAAEGLVAKEIGARLGLARSTAWELLDDPWREKARARRLGYRGTCQRCGEPTSGDGGPRQAPKLCKRCAPQVQHEARYWTRPRIIAAIWKHDAAYGGPPMSHEWLYGPASVGAAAVSVVIREFGSWANAIEAAGYERPRIGHKRKKGDPSMANSRRYLVLVEKGGAWEPLAETDAHTALQALQRALNGTTEEGRYVAVPARYFEPRRLRPVTRFEWVPE